MTRFKRFHRLFKEVCCAANKLSVYTQYILAIIATIVMLYNETVYHVRSPYTFIAVIIWTLAGEVIRCRRKLGWYRELDEDGVSQDASQALSPVGQGVISADRAREAANTVMHRRNQ